MKILAKWNNSFNLIVNQSLLLNHQLSIEEALNSSSAKWIPEHSIVIVIQEKRGNGTK